MAQVEAKLKEMGVAFLVPPPPAGNYVSAVRTGNLVYVAGVGPRNADGEYILGKLGRDLTVDEGYEAARWCAINMLTNLHLEIGGGLLTSYSTFANKCNVL